MTVANTINHLKMVAEKEGIQYEEQALAVIAEKADGGMRDALSIFDQAASFCMGNITYQKVIEDLNVLDSDNYFRLVDLALENKVAEMMVTLDGILSRGFDGGNMIQGLAQHVRNVMMAKDPQTLPLLETSDDQKAKFQAQAQKAPTPFLYKALELMNQCDIHYRASSNKRLLVELTLIQIYFRLRSPRIRMCLVRERTPNRLKSLFQKLLAQSKLASQGAGSEPSGSSENRSSQPGTSAATATAVPSSGAPTAASAASNAASYSASATAAASASPEDSATAGAATDAASPHKPRLKNIKLGGIGMTFSNLKKREENQRRLHSPYDDTNEEKATITGDQNEFTQEQVEATWFSMCMRMQNKLDFIGLANRMKSIVPKITNYPQIEVIINNQLLLDDVLNIKNRILKTFVLGLHNSELSISYRLADQEEVGKVLTKNEVLELLMEKNPAMKKLTKDLDLVMT